MDEWEEDVVAETILGQTTALFAGRGREDLVALLVDVAGLFFVDTATMIGELKNAFSTTTEPIYGRAAVLDVDDHLVDRFTDTICEEITDVLRYVADRNGERNVIELRARPTLPTLTTDWRDTFAAALSSGVTSNQARRERLLAGHPVIDALTFGSDAETRLYLALKGFQRDAPEDRTVAILPSPGARLRAGHTWTPDFVVIGNGRAVVFEIDGPHHRTNRRLADDSNRNLQWQRCGVHTVRLAVEDLNDTDALSARVAEELKRHLTSP